MKIYTRTGDEGKTSIIGDASTKTTLESKPTGPLMKRTDLLDRRSLS